LSNRDRPHDTEFEQPQTHWGWWCDFSGDSRRAFFTALYRTRLGIGSTDRPSVLWAELGASTVWGDALSASINHASARKVLVVAGVSGVFESSCQGIVGGLSLPSISRVLDV
jgi:hypothetical protein